MRRILCALFLAGMPLLLPASGLAEESRETEEISAEKLEISDEDRQVIRKMELLQLMELLKDMDLLEREIKADSEDKK
ncbi:hypothetical protein [Desulfuromonas sp. TF]|uniref:hypothetical protein n=1 Tax=Desulfuromonas sp. TF TaxID=1232410 RepID=UPI00041E4132|nr:hypothetical protein [Desulfuromonas sp. TF]